MFAEDMSLVTDNNIDGRKGWKKFKYGRAVSVKCIRRNDGTKPPLDQLTYFYNDFINLSDDEKKHQNDNSTSENEGQNGNIPSPDKLPQSIIDSLKKLKNKSRVIAAPEVSDNFNLFDSDEEYNNNEKPTLGESGRERLNLQKKFRSDDRFKLASDFVSDDGNNDTDEIISCKMSLTLRRKISNWDSDHEDLSTFTSSIKDVKIEINADLKGMFVLKALTPFSLFGGNTESEECEDV
ncbi:hypothetical protein C2G38_2163557 [Gigaspora rosea]|uniref:Uncharacterized protein n=1 Tax=Gigaspora rosea TaxID=44941 RepID=A0A397VYE2_9GLOM|nr:hypothetical protein C2G38_2163557 [Gigaspora rosea]